MTSANTRKQLRTILGGNRSVLMATVIDPISARIAERLGCEAALMGGSLASLAVLGAPDLIVLTLSELAEQVHRCTRASRVPLVVDGDHGYGNALNVMRAIEELDHAGAAAVSIEDTLLPRAFGAGDGQQLLGIDEGAGKMRAAVASRGDSDIVVLGRTSATLLAGVDEAIARFRAYEAAGVDALMIPGLRARAELDAIAAATRLPLVVGGLPEAMCDPAYLASRRAVLWSGGHQTVNVAINAMYEAMKAVHEGLLASKLPGTAPKAILELVTDAGAYTAATDDYLRRPA